MSRNKIMINDMKNEKKTYSKPEMTYELELETRAGTPVSALEGNPLDLLSLESNALSGNE